jgi:hypothetical protein
MTEQEFKEFEKINTDYFINTNPNLAKCPCGNVMDV